MKVYNKYELNVVKLEITGGNQSFTIQNKLFYYIHFKQEEVFIKMLFVYREVYYNI